jgi:peptidoglycan-N-acetylglucosamine deacetylase
MQPSAPIAPVPPSTAAPNSRRRFLFLSGPFGRVLLVLAGIAVLYCGTIWYTRYRGTGWSQTFNFSLWYHRSRGEDLYHTDEALLLHGNRGLREVALTFDDGPHPKSRPQILDILKRRGVHATFFDVGANMARNPDLLRRTLADGHEVANHTDHHLYLPDLSASERRREINDPDITFFAITGRHLDLLRPPGMRFNGTVLADARRLGYVVVSYTTAAKDADATDPAPPDVIAERTLSRVENGSILLLHDYPSTAEALPAILAALQARGYRCVTISEMLDHLPEPVRTDSRLQRADAQ